MTQEQKINYMRIAADLCQFHFKEEHMDLLISLYELVLEKKGNADMRDVAKIQAKIKGRHPEKKSKNP
jgi:hypothetical protein